MAPISYAERLEQLAASRGADVAIVSVATDGAESTWTWQELRAKARARAAALRDTGVGPGALVVVALPNSLDWYAVVYGAWYCGATVLPLDPALSAGGREPVLELAAEHWAPVVLVDESTEEPPAPGRDVERAVTPPPDPGIVMLSGGSTGRPKIIVNEGPHVAVPVPDRPVGMTGEIGLRVGQVQLVPGPLFHGAPASWSTTGLFHGHRLIVMTRFDADLAAHLIERHGVQWAFLVPTMMRRIAQLPDISAARLMSLESFVHASAPCPESVKRAWLDLIGPSRVFEAFGGSEAAGATVISGEEWLRHPGSVGKPMPGYEVAVLDDAGLPVPPGEVGLIHMRPAEDPTRARFRYIGAPRGDARDGWISIGDLGWLDEDGYLFVADRRTDLIITGGANVYPAEVEGVLLDHPGVSDVAVIGVDDSDLGRRVHAVVEPRDLTTPPEIEDLIEHCRQRLSKYKVPRSVEFVAKLPRNDQGKLRRSALVPGGAA
ncbi:MAG: bile acid-coenzyme ligase [Actinomycetota bacterium]|jgi:bile acid-coenzyme A ligase|nr:bile acid-coenzyme ligase [Actinomycetota bacterium]